MSTKLHVGNIPSTAQEDDYEIVSVESTIPPEPTGGTGWHCYVIGQGKNTIRGYQQGSLEAVRQSAEEIVTSLNERRLGKRSSHS